MLLPLGKLSILVGAGIVGSVLAKEGRLPTTSDLFSGAFKGVLKILKVGDSPTPNAKPKNDVWLQQVNSLREEIQFYASNRPIMIVSSSSSGGRGRAYYVIIIIVVAGGFLWWKGWKLPDLGFATKRSLSDASSDVEKKLQNVHSSIETTKQQITSKLKDVDEKLDETKTITEAAQIDVTHLLREDVKFTDDKVKSILQAFEYLEATVDRFEGKQRILFCGMRTLLNFVHSHERKAAINQIEVTPSSTQSVNRLPQPTPSGVIQKQGSMLDTGLKLDLVPNGNEASSQMSPQPSRLIDASTSKSGNGSSGFGLFGRQSSVGPVVNRTRSLNLTFNI